VWTDPLAENLGTRLAYNHDLTLPQGRQLAELVLDSLTPGWKPDAARHLADAAVADRFVWMMVGPDVEQATVDRLERYAWQAVADGDAPAGAWFALASVADHRGLVAEQRRYLDSALAIDPDFWPVIGDLGFLAYVEGDVGRAKTLLRRSRDPNASSMLHLLSHVEAALRPAQTRNSPCACGSGAKYKQCCGAVLQVPPKERAIWLWDKAEVWVHRTAQQAALSDAADHLARVDDLDDDRAIERELALALDYPVLEGALLLERGLLRRFVDRYTGLLSTEELDLAARWSEARHGVWSVVATRPGSSLTMVDLATGQQVEAINGSVSRCTSPGEVVFAVVLPTGGGWLLPQHPEGLDPAGAAVIMDLMTGADPWDVVTEVHRRACAARGAPPGEAA
jgi:hypothetical protein